MKTRAPRKNPSEASAPSAEIVFVIDVSALTKEGFVGSSTYEGKQVELGFDDSGKGVYLTPEMAARLHVRKGSRVSLVLEGESTRIVDLVVGGVGKRPRISDAKAYYAVGREGGAVVRLRRA